MSAPEFDADEWAFLPPLTDADLPAQPPARTEQWQGVTIGSALAPLATCGPATDLARSVAETIAGAAPGLAEIARLGSTDLDSLDAVAGVSAVIAIERQQAWLAALKQRVLGQLISRDPSEEHWCIEEVGAALALSSGQARTQLAHAEQLALRLPETWQALADGVLTDGQAESIVKASFVLPDELLPAFEARVLPGAADQSSTGLARRAQRAAHSLDPATVQQKTERSIAERHVRIEPAGHGTAWLTALLPAADACAIRNRLNSAADSVPKQDRRTRDQVRADTLVEALLAGIDNIARSPEQGRRPSIHVTVGLDTLTGLDEQPGWLDGYGPISAGYAREIAHDPTGTWRRLITDPVDGTLLDLGTTRYRPPAHLAEHVIVRDGECAFPYCTHQARQSDLDHVRPFPDGPTAAPNLQPLHRRHHNAKTRNGWRNERDPVTGHTHWTSPQGRRYTTRPSQRWPLPGDGDPNPPPTPPPEPPR